VAFNGSMHHRALASLYIPGLFVGMPGQALFLLLPLYVLDIGGSVAAAAAVIGFRGAGMLVMGVPAGWLTTKYGYRKVITWSSVLILFSFLSYGICHSLSSLYILAFVHGLASSSFLLGRMACISSSFSSSERGRVIAMIAGVLRLSTLIGPLIAGLCVDKYGFAVTFQLCGTMVFLASVCTISFLTEGPSKGQALKLSAIPSFLSEYKQIFLTAGLAAFGFMFMRSARTVLIPLMGAYLAFDATVVGLVVSISAAIDLALFYPAGIIMDRWGRRFTAVPSSIIFALSLGAISLCESYSGLLTAAVAAGFANGLSTGIVMTLGTDHAPDNKRGEFLGFWRLITDFGNVSGPMLISGMILVASLPAAALMTGCVGAAASVIVYRHVDETLAK
jgi:MFS family permease